MSPVHINELNLETRAKVLKQIEATQGTTALAALEPKTHPFYTPAEMRARSILSRIESVSAKLKTLEADIRALWLDFDNLKTGETILGCATKKEFCEKKLHRHPRTVQYLLAGQSNPIDRPHKEPSELSSPAPAPEPAATPARGPARIAKANPGSDGVDATEVDPFEELQSQLSYFRPSLVDTHQEKQFVRVLEQARTTQVTDDRMELARTDVGMLREIANDMLSAADEIEQRIAEAV
jgi:hypothetical protein